MMGVVFAVVVVSTVVLPVTNAGRTGVVSVALRPTPLIAKAATSNPVTPLLGERVLVMGDSLIAESESELRARFDALGVEHRVLGLGRSGLLNPEFIDWKSTATAAVADFQPSVVVVEFCCNYWPPYLRDENGAEILPGSEAFKQKWAEQAAELADIVTADGARLYWVVTPPTAGQLQATIDVINATTWEAVERADPPIRVVRWDLAFTAGTGTFRKSILIDGHETVVRDPDLLHFSEAGARVAARSVIETLLADSPKRWAPFGDPVDFVLQVHRDLTGAPDDVAAAEVTAARLQRGQGDRTDVVNELALGEKWGAVIEPLIRLHLAYTGVVPSHLWLRAALKRARDGAPLIQEAERLLGVDDRGDGWSPIDDGGFLERLHWTAFGRHPLARDIDRWERDSKSGVSRAHLLVNIANSPEFQTGSMGAVRTISLYEGMLYRVPTDKELDSWSPRVAEGAPAGLVNHLLESDEYADRLTAGRRAPLGPGVVGGAALYSGPSWLVALVEHDDKIADGVLCAGALVDASWVVTTAGCVMGRPVGSFDILVGWDGARSRPAERVAVNWIYMSPTFRSATLDDDLAVIELSDPVSALPIAVGRNEPDTGRAVAGWSRHVDGSTGAPRLAELGSATDADCIEAHGPAYHPDSMRCAGLPGGGVDACQGGAPLITSTGSRPLLVGLVSWGSGCAKPGAPAVAARLDADEAMLDFKRYRPPYPSPPDAVTGLFVRMEGRFPTDDERARWTPTLSKTADAHADLALDLVRSDRRRSINEPLVRMWIALAGSPPSMGDVAQWVSRRLGKIPFHQIVSEMASRPEVLRFLRESGDREFLSSSYQRILGRRATASQLSLSLDDLRSGRRSRADVVIDLAQSPAGIEHLRPRSEAVLATQSLLRRTPTADEFSNWITELDEGLSSRDLVQRILTSEEMANR